MDINNNGSSNNINDFYDISKLKFGDIVLCLRDKDLDVGHKVGPYIVVRIKDDKLYCVKGTSVEPSNNNIKYIYKIKAGTYGLSKDTYFDYYTVREVDKSQFMQHISKLDKKEKLYLRKKMSCYGAYKRVKQVVDDFTPAEYGVGDVLCKFDVGDNIREFFFIISYSNNKFQCIKLNKFGEENLIEVRSRKYFVNYDEIYEFQDFKDFVRHDYFPNNAIKFILSIIKLKQSNPDFKNDEITRGSVVFDSKSLYYVYATEQHKHLAYKIDYEQSIDTEEVYAGDTTYYTKFNKEISFDEKDKTYIKINQATNDQIEENRTTKKFAKKKSTKTKKYANSPTGFLYYSPSTLCFVRGVGQCVVIYRTGGSVTLLNYEKFKSNREIDILQRNATELRIIRSLYSNEFIDMLIAIDESNNKYYDKNQFKNVYRRFISGHDNINRGLK